MIRPIIYHINKAQYADEYHVNGMFWKETKIK